MVAWDKGLLNNLENSPLLKGRVNVPTKRKSKPNDANTSVRRDDLLYLFEIYFKDL